MKQLVTRRRELARQVIALTAACAVSSASAQLEEVIVTAQKHTQSVNDVGITVNAFSGDTLRDLGVTEAAEIALYTPGLSVNAAGATGVPVYTIRGVGALQDLTTSTSSTVGLYFDEVSIPYSVMSRGVVYDIERVEVLKGPQGDLYGRNTTAGQINWISRKPTDEFEAGFSASYGRFETFELDGFLSGPLTDNIQGRLAFKTVQSGEGWQESVTTGDELGEKDTTSIRTLLNFNIGDNANLLLNVHYVDDQSDNTAQQSIDGRRIGLNEFSSPYKPLNEYLLPTGSNFGDPVPWYAGDDAEEADWTNSWTNPVTGETDSLRPERDNQTAGIYAKLDWDLGDMTFTSITGYDDFQREETNDVDGQPNSVQENINETDIETFSQELRLTGQTDKMLWIGGLYYAQDDLEEFYNFFMADSVFGDGSAAWDLGNSFASFPIRRLHTKYEQETESYAIFGHIEYNLSDKMRLTVGARYTEEERDWSGCTFDAGDGGLAAFWNATPFSPTLQAGDCATLDDLPNSPNFIGNVAGTPDVNNAWHVLDFDISTEKWMGKIGLDYAFTDDILGYAMISTGFKSGGFNGNNSNTAAQLVPYEPEEVTSYELGLKSTLLNGTMQLNAAAFYYDYEDKQESERAITPVGAIGGTGNVPESEIYGAELDLQWAPTDGLLLQTGVAYLDSEIKKWVTPVSGDYNLGTGQPENVVFVDASGGALPQTPEWSVMALASYEWSITDGLMMQVAADVNYTDDQPDPVRVANSLESWTLYNARISVADVNNQWRLMLWGRNLGDEYYYAAAFNGPNGGYMRTAGMPRTYGVRFDYNF